MKDDSYYFHQTPVGLARVLINTVPLEEGDRVLEPFRGEGAFYNSFPDFVNKDWCEIEEGRDFKDYNEDIDWIITNPPFRLDVGTKRINAFYTILKHFSTKVNKGIAFLANDVCLGTLTPLRLTELHEHGLYIHSIKVCSVKKWRGRYFFIIFKKEPSSFFSPVAGNWE
jgi:hypothetical protein